MPAGRPLRPRGIALSAGRRERSWAEAGGPLRPLSCLMIFRSLSIGARTMRAPRSFLIPFIGAALRRRGPSTPAPPIRGARPANSADNESGARPRLPSAARRLDADDAAESIRKHSGRRLLFGGRRSQCDLFFCRRSFALDSLGDEHLAMPRHLALFERKNKQTKILIGQFERARAK